MKKKICLIFSTRPEIIKLFPIIKILNKAKKNFFCINTGQHYDFEMHKIFMDEFKLKNKIYNLHSSKITNPILFFSECFKFLDKVIKKEKPTHLIIQGDTNTGLIGALCCSLINREIKNKIKIIHVEAGLRSFDESMPEEINRKIIDILSSVLFVPTKIDLKNLKRENLIDTKKVFKLGNTIVDSLNHILKKNKKHLSKNSISHYFLLTLHRPETVDDKLNFKKILLNLNSISEKYKIPFIFPIHPRSYKKIPKSFIKKIKNIKIIKPVKYVEFIKLLINTKIVYTDSGGIQEEAYILNKRCITIRKNTERQITTINGSNIVVGYERKKIFQATKKLINSKIRNKNVFGNVGLSKKIVNKLL